MVGRTGFEPVTSALKVQRPRPLDQRPIVCTDYRHPHGHLQCYLLDFIALTRRRIDSQIFKERGYILGSPTADAGDLHYGG